MRYFNGISPTVLCYVALLLGLDAVQTQDPDALQVLKEETAHSKRKRGPLLSNTYEDFELNSCTLSFTEKVLHSFKDITPSDSIKYGNRISKYTFPLQSLDAGLEWLNTYESFVVSLSGPGTIYKVLTDYKGPAPNISIPFADENSAKRAEMALHRAIAACGGRTDPDRRTNASARQGKKDLTSDVNDKSYKIKVDVELVAIDVMATGENAPELRAEDFIVYDNNVVQQISHFSHDRHPISAAILLGANHTGTESYEPYIAALSALRILQPEDQAALYSLTGDRLCNLTDDRLHIASILSYIADNYLRIDDTYRTLCDAARYLKQEASGRRVIILISENINYGLLDAAKQQIRPYDNSPNWSELSELRRVSNSNADISRIELLEASTTLYDVIANDNTYSDDYFPTNHRETSQTIKRITEETGGEVLVVDGQTSIKNRLEQGLNRLRTQYTLGFTPSDPGEYGSFHQLKVRFANKDRCPTCRIKARPGYYAGISAPLPSLKKIQAKTSQSYSEVDDKLIQQSMVHAGYYAKYDLDEIAFELKNAERTADSNGQYRLKADLSINPNGVDTEIQSGRQKYNIQAALFQIDKKGHLLGSNFWKIEGSFNGEANKHAAIQRIAFSATIPLKGKDPTLRIAIYDERSGRIGSKFVKRKGKGYVLDSHPVPTVEVLMKGYQPYFDDAPFSSK